MSKMKELRGRLWVKVVAFLLALASGVAVCAGLGGVCYSLNYVYDLDAERYENTESYYWSLISMADMAKEYAFLSLYEDSLTEAGTLRKGELEQALAPTATNFRYLLSEDEKGGEVLGNSDGRMPEEETERDYWSVSAYELGQERNVGYYLDLSKETGWDVTIGTVEGWNDGGWASVYYYTIEDYILMLEEVKDLSSALVSVRTEEADLEDTTDTGVSHRTVAVDSNDAPSEETIVEEQTALPEEMEEPLSDAESEEGVIYYHSQSKIPYVVIDGERYSYDRDGLYVYYRFDPDTQKNYTLTCWVEPDLPVEDDFRYMAESFEQGKTLYDRYFLPNTLFSAAMLLLFLVALALLTWTVGWNSRGELALRGANTMASELVCLLLAGGFLVMMGALWFADRFYLGREYYFHWFVGVFSLAGLIFGPFCLGAWMIWAAQLKTHQLLRRSLCGRLWLKFWNWCKKLWRDSADWVKQLVEGRALYQKIIIYFLIYLVPYMLWMVGISVHVWNGGSGLGGCFIAFVLPLLPLLAFACKWALDWAKMRQQVKKLIEGDFESALDTTQMLPDLRSHGEDLNNLSAGLSKAVEERVKSQRFKTELITNVSHDLKTPLTSIINYVDLLKQADIADETVRGYIEVLDRKSQRLKTLTEDLVEASKAASGTITVHLEALDVIELAEQAAGEYDERLKLADLTVLIKKPEEPLKVMADGRHLWRILDNLLSNCTKYAMPGTRVYLDISQKDGMGVIEVKNISADPLNVPEEELMKRFVRGDSARSTEGSGLGLSIARNLTLAQKGDFRLVVDGDLFKAVVMLPAAE